MKKTSSIPRKTRVIFMIIGIFIFLIGIFFWSEKNNLPLSEEGPKVPAGMATLTPLVVPPEPSELKKDCKITKRQDTVQGGSMNGILASGDKITILEGYYGCNEAKRDDLVIFHFAGNTDPLVKSIRGLPGDTLSLKRNENGYWNIVVNGKVLRTSTGQPYAISDAKERMLALYIDSYHGDIPRDTFLILGNLPEGTMDSTQFGLVSSRDFIGKVER